jgi:hypothetical protein
VFIYTPKKIFSLVKEKQVDQPKITFIVEPALAAALFVNILSYPCFLFNLSSSAVLEVVLDTCSQVFYLERS